MGEEDVGRPSPREYYTRQLAVYCMEDPLISLGYIPCWALWAERTRTFKATLYSTLQGLGFRVLGFRVEKLVESPSLHPPGSACNTLPS